MATFTEGQAARALAQFFDWQKRPVFINVNLFSWEMDVCVLTDAGYLWEIEVKCSLADWRADQFKDKWKSKDIDKVSRLYYAVPWTLLDKVPEFVPDHVGLISLHVNDDGTGLRAKMHREAKSKRGYTLTPPKLIQLYKSTYYKYWGNISPKEAKEESTCYISLEEESPSSEDSSTSWSGRSPISPPSFPKSGSPVKPKLSPLVQPKSPSASKKQKTSDCLKTTTGEPSATWNPNGPWSPLT